MLVFDVSIAVSWVDDSYGAETQLLSQRGRDALLPHSEPLLSLPAVRSEDETITLQLTAIDAVNQLGPLQLAHQSFNGQLVGPTVRIRPGRELRILLRNDLTEHFEPGHTHKGAHVHELARTNVHTHGLHVSPRFDSDNVFLNLSPGEALGYKFEIPSNHPPGTHWYHPHVHGNVAFQVANGMAGALIVEGGFEDST